MISMKKQLLAMLIGVGVFTLVLTSGAVNVGIRNEFKEYVEYNIALTSEYIVREVEKLYSIEKNWERVMESPFLNNAYTSNFAFSIIDLDGELIWGKTREELLLDIENMEYPVMYGKPLEVLSKDKSYEVKDLEVIVDDEIVGYVRIEYFPAYLLSQADIVFQSKINSAIIIYGAIAIIAFSILSVYVTQLFTRPIYALARTSVDLAGGRYKTRYNRVSKIKEIENLRYSINYLAERLESQDTLRKKLISDVSHEIRTPLHVLQSNLEAMIDGIYPTDEEQLQVLYGEVVRFGSLLNNLDKLKSTEENLQPIYLERIMLNPALNQIFGTFKIVAIERCLIYRIDIKESEGVIIKADLHALKQIFMNLLSNSFKFTSKGKISLKTKVIDKKVQVILQDTGIGIAEKDLPNIFERMYRGDESREKYEGSGIGLTIVKKLIVEHGGQIEVVSKPNKGTKIICTFPIVQIDRARQNKANYIKK